MPSVPPAGPAAAPATAGAAVPPPGARLAPWVGLGVAALLVAASIVLPVLFGWDTETRRDDKVQLPPLHGFWDPKLVPLSALAIALALLGWRYAERVAERLPWRALLLACFVVGFGWLVALALVDGEAGLTRVLGNPYEYLETAREVDDVGLMLETFVDRIPFGLDDAWVTHVAGHPPGALLFFVGLVRIGLGGDLAAALVVTGLAATTAPAVLVTLRALGAEQVARRAAPFLVLTPAAVFMAVSADAMFAAVAAWGLACLALGATARRAGAVPGLVGARGAAAGRLRDAVLRAAAAGAARARGAVVREVLVAAPGRRRGRAGRGAGLRGGRLRVVGGLPRAGGPLPGGRGQRAAAVVLGVGQPGSAADLRRPPGRRRGRAPRGHASGGCRARRRRWSAPPSPPSCSPTCPACRSRRWSGSGCRSSRG